MCMPMLIASMLMRSPQVERTQCPRADKWTNKMCALRWDCKKAVYRKADPWVLLNLKISSVQ